MIFKKEKALSKIANNHGKPISLFFNWAAGDLHDFVLAEDLMEQMFLA